MGVFANRLIYNVFGGLIPDGKIGLKILGHRLFVGGKWDQIGKLQYDFLLKEGLKPENCLLDIGCGALRGGVHFIQYLNEGNYLGFDKNKELIDIGIKRELGEQLSNLKKPEFVVSSSFEFDKFKKKPQYSLSLSLFTHLNSSEIESCLHNLKQFVDEGHFYYATFFLGDSVKNPTNSHSLDHFEYSVREMRTFGENAGWKVEYLGDWCHPRKQMMIKYIA